MDAPIRRWITRSIAAPAVIAIVISAGFVGLRLFVFADGDITKFVVAGSALDDRDRVPEGLFVRHDTGYDGQFYYRLALDPFNFQHTAFGMSIDDPLRRDRILYPVVVHVVSLGSHDAVPWILVIVNVAAMGAIGLCGAALARASGRAPLWGLLFVAIPTLFLSIGRDLTEPLEIALLLAALLALRRERWAWATVAFSCAALTREPAIVVVAAIGAERVWCWARRTARPGARDLAWIIPSFIFVAWQAVIKIETGHLGVTGADDDATAPFFGLPKLLDRLRDVLRGFHLPGLLQNAETLTLLLVVVLAIVALRVTIAPRSERWAFVALAIFASTFFGSGSWLEIGGAPRAYADLYALALVILVGTRWRLRVPMVLGAGVTVFAMVQSVRVV